MNKFTLMLGILLLAGFSFAVDVIPDNWMMYSVDKYSCNYAYNGMGYIGGHYAMGFMKIAATYDNCDEPAYWSCNEMSDALIDMGTALNGEKGGSGMCTYSGCGRGEERVEPSVTSFRSSMLEYNLISASFNSYFLAGLSAYLADGGDRAAVLADLREAKADYLMCLRDVYEDGPCWTCGRLA